MRGARRATKQRKILAAASDVLRGAGHRAGHFGPDPLARNDALLAQHPEGVQVGLENGLLLLAFVDVLLAQAHDCAQGLGVEAAGFGFAIDIADVIGENETTLAVKGVNDQPKTSVQKAIQLAVAAVKVSERLDNPWLRAIILSPSVQRFLSTLAFGARDVTYLASLMVKPASSVMMTFTSDPNRGLSQDHFSGSAIVFLSTITYPTRTASLQ